MSEQFFRLEPGRRFSWVFLALLGLTQWFCFTANGATTTAAADANWPQWRGPLQNGVAPQADPPTEWSETKNVKWKVKISGEGHATPVIWGEKVFVLAAIPTGKNVEPKAADASEQIPSLNVPRQTFFGQVQQPAPGGGGDPGQPRPFRGGPGGRGGRGGFGGGPKPTEAYQFAVLCLDRQTGKVLWQQTAREEVPHEGHHPTGTFSSSSALTDGKRVLAYFGSRGLYAYDLNGKLEWSQDFGDMRIAMGFGEGSSPAQYGDTLVVNWDHEGESFIIALDKNTGKTLWKNSRDERTSWSTPLIAEHDGKPQVITTATGKIRSYDLATGKLIWECGGLTRNVIPTPVVGNGMVYCISGFQGFALLAIRLGKSGDLTDSDAIAWRYNKATPYVPSPLLYGDKLYFFSNNHGILSCFDAVSGKPFYTEETLPEIPRGSVYASPVGAAGKIYLAARNGVTHVLKNADKLEVLATNRLDEKFDASPAAVGKELFLRGHESLYCIAEK